MGSKNRLATSAKFKQVIEFFEIDLLRRCHETSNTND